MILNAFIFYFLSLISTKTLIYRTAFPKKDTYFMPMIILRFRLSYVNRIIKKQKMFVIYNKKITKNHFKKFFVIWYQSSVW